MRRGFSLIELIVVVLILGILAAVAAPGMFDAASDARDSALTHSLGVVRDAIQLHQSTTGALPGDAGSDADFKADLLPFLQQFPENPLNNSAAVAVKTDGAPFSGTIPGGAGWRYDNVSGDFIANSDGHWEL